MTNSVLRTILRAGCFFTSAIRLKRTFAAWRPSSRDGWRTTVKPGGIISASSKSSNDINPKSLVIRFFRTLSPRRTSMVQTQFSEKMASTLLGPERNVERTSGVRSFSCWTNSSKVSAPAVFIAER